jgi:signal transduction histidine kinase
VSRFERFNVSSRVFCLAAVLGLSFAFFDADALRATILLAAVSSSAVAADFSSRLPQSWISAAEGALAALVVSVALPDGVVLLPYLVVPAMVVGLSSGVRAVVAVLVAEALALSLLPVTEGGGADFTALASLLLPWLLTSLGVGLLTAWMRERGIGTRGIPVDESYESARRLLSQLRTVARRLSAGLDTVTMSSQLLVVVQRHLADTHSAVFIRTEGGVLAPLAYRGLNARESLQPGGSLVEKVWAEMEPGHEIQPSGAANRRHRVVLPLRVGSRMIGVVALDRSQPPSVKALTDVMPEVDEFALRLDAALAFDEIRSLATMEERQRLAREIHDGVAQEIASLGYVVDSLAADATSDSQRKRINALRSELSRVVSELRLSIFDLRTEVSAGLGSALSDYVREVGARSGLTVHLTLDVAPTRLRGEVETELFRIAQEAITNARKHSDAANLWVDCRIQPPHARISIRDDGDGLGTPREDSFGIKIMKERAGRINAELEITENAPPHGPKGTCVTVTVGVEEPAYN